MQYVLGPTCIIYEIVKRQNDKNGIRNSFMADDIFSILTDQKEMAIIYDVYTTFDDRCKGYAKSAVKKFIQLMSSQMPVGAVSSLLKKYFPVEPTLKEINDTLLFQGKFLDSCGFTNINEYVGYESEEAFLYANDMTKPYFEFCKQKIEERINI